MHRVPPVSIALAVFASCAPEPAPAPLALEEWERGIAVRSLEREGMDMYLWFYEWNLFDAFEPGESTPGTTGFEREVAPDGRSARLSSEAMTLDMEVDSRGVALRLSVTNLTERAWPEVAAIVPCFNPGPLEVRNQELAHHHATWYLGAAGPERIEALEIHLNQAFRPALMERATEGRFEFSKKWPPTGEEGDAYGGLVLRQSRDWTWVTAIGWEEFLTAQAHNPWQCMHLSVRLGPLAPGETKVIRGRIWHRAGGVREVVEEYREEFGG